MVKYIGKVISFLLGLGILVTGIIVLSATNEPLNQFFAFISCSEEYERQEVETQTIINTMEANNEYSSIVVGDSVCYLLFYGFQERNDEYLFSGITRPATIATHYTMIKEFLETHPDAEEVYMMLSYDTWRTMIDVQCGYSYFVATNTLAGTMDNYDQHTIQEAEELFGSFLMNPSIVQLYDASLMNHKIVLNSLIWYHENVNGMDLSSSAEFSDGISELALTYFHKIENLCKEKDVELYLIHDPLMDTEKKHNELEMEKQIFKDAGLYEKYKAYFETVIFYPEECFFDSVHLNVEEELQSQVIQDIKEHTGLFDGLIVD